MIRVLTVVVIATLCTTLLGIDGVSAAQSKPSHAQVLAARVAKMKVGDAVKIQRADGKKIEGVLTGVTSDTVTVDIYRPRPFRRRELVGTETFVVADLRDIKKPNNNAAIATAIVLGACAIVVTADLKPGERPVAEPGADSENSRDRLLRGTVN